MAAGINLPFFADVRNFLKGTDSIADALDDVAGSLDDLDASSKASADGAGDAIADGIQAGAKDASKSVDKLERDVSDNMDGIAKDAKTAGNKAGDAIADGMKDGVTAAGKFEDKVSGSFRAVAADAKAAGDKVSTSQKHSFDEASEGAETFKENAGANAKEVAASFDGSFESISDGFQGLAAEMLEGFGPAGLIAGVAIAAGIGLATTAMQENADKATELKQKSVDMLDAITEVGGDLSKLDYAETIKAWGREVMEDNWITFWADESTTKFQEAAKDAKAAGVDYKDAIRAAGGSADDSRKFLDQTAESWQRLTRMIDAGTTTTEDGLQVQDESAKKALAQRNALSDLRGQAEDNIKTTGNAVEIYKIENGVVEDGTKAIEEKNDALLKQVDAMNAAAGKAMDALEAEISYNDAMSQGAKDIAANGAGLDLHTAVGKANQQTLVDMAKAANDLQAAQIAQGDSTASVTAKTQEARDAFTAAAEKAGYGAAEAQALADKYGLIPKDVKTKVEAHGVQEAKDQIDGVAKPRTAPVQVVPTEAPGAFANFIAGMNGKKVFVDVVPRNGVGITN